MRPINLIPPEDRRGEQAPLRTGPFAYVVVGALVAVLAGVTAMVLTGNQISERKAELTTLEAEDSAEAAKAEKLAAYTQFRAMSEQRISTVASLADSRFDWERVMRELALVLPSDVWLVTLEAFASSASGEGGDTGLTSSTQGPALVLSGCADGQEGVAGFVTALKDIDGVTRVGVETSELGDASSGAGGSDGGEDCRTRQSIAKFSITVAFDAAPVPLGGVETAPPSASDTAEGTSDEAESDETSEESGEESEGG
jgi:Tfp pilus assembly protein PilN